MLRIFRSPFLRSLRRRYSRPTTKALIHFILLSFVWLANTYFQVFCKPSLWASILLVFIALHFIIPIEWIKGKFRSALYYFLQGIGLFVCVYCIVFLEGMNAVGFILVFFFGIGLLIYVPYYFAFRILWNQKNHGNTLSQIAFLSALGLCILGSIAIQKAFKKEGDRVFQAYESSSILSSPTFLSEKIVGMHFLYHTQFCAYDGWRPPIHEPILVLGYWLNGKNDPLPISLEERIELYTKWFPNQKVKLNCSCAQLYGSNYHQDPLWIPYLNSE